MPDWPFGGASRYISYTATVTSPAASANTMGNYSELVAATPYAASGILLAVDRADSGPKKWLVDVAIGNAGSEIVIVQHLHIANGSSWQGTSPSILFPIQIPTGSKLSARCQCSSIVASSAIVTATIVSSSFLGSSPLGRVITYGSNSGTSGGTSIDPGAVAGTKGAWIQLVAATTIRTKALAGIFGGQANNGRTATYWAVDVGIGNPGSEVLVIPDLLLTTTTGDDAFCPSHFGPLPISIPAGTALSARASCGIVDATDRLFDLILYGVG